MATGLPFPNSFKTRFRTGVRGGEDDRKVFPRKQTSENKPHRRISFAVPRRSRAGESRRIRREDRSSRHRSRGGSRRAAVRRSERRRAEENLQSELTSASLTRTSPPPPAEWCS